MVLKRMRVLLLLLACVALTAGAAAQKEAREAQSWYTELMEFRVRGTELAAEIGRFAFEWPGRQAGEIEFSVDLLSPEARERVREYHRETVTLLQEMRGVTGELVPAVIDLGATTPSYLHLVNLLAEMHDALIATDIWLTAFQSRSLSSEEYWNFRSHVHTSFTLAGLFNTVYELERELGR